MNNPSLNCFYNIKQQKRPKYNITRTPNIIYLFYRYRRIKIISNLRVLPDGGDPHERHRNGQCP